uniref:Ionotropic glutamate receptor C-terminal domain-containing protein n=1 Tax=Leersia perrieri TaxID=77586 RepID=A0A0D9XDY9_9ORYZ
MEKSAERAALFFLLLSLTVAQNITESGTGTLNVGVILHLKSLVGKMARTSILMAVEDFYAVHRGFKTKLVLHIRDSNGDDIQAASEAATIKLIALLFHYKAIDLLENYNVKVIVGPQKSSEATFVSDIGNKSHVPVISFTATNPTLSSINVPYFVRGTLSDVAQVNTIAALIKAYGWREVVPVYEDTDYGRGIIPYLADALQEFGASMPYRSAISIPANTEQVERELYKLMTMQTRVYVVHMSVSIASILFTKAKELGMMSKDYAWILTDGITNIVNSLSPSILQEMNGAIGVRFYVPASKELHDFTKRWNKRFEQDYPNDPPPQLSIFGLWGYDTIWALAQAAEKVRMADAIFQKQKDTKNSTCLGALGISTVGTKLLDSILNSKFRGLSGEFDLRNRQLDYSTFQIINVVGSRTKEIGFWAAKYGIFRQLNENKTTNMNSMPDLNPVMWPGEVYTVPKGWQIPTNGKKLRVGVRISGYPELMKVETNPVTNEISASGYAIDVFEEVLKRLPYAIPYEYVTFDNGGVNSGSYNDFVYQVHLGVYDAAIGDITIRYNRTSYVDFTLPYTESGVAMIVPVKDDRDKNMWVFLKPLTTDLWFGSIAFFIYTAIVIWLLERRINNAELTGSFFRQLGIAIYFSFFADRERVDSILSRLVVIVWVFVLLVITSSYTANLSSMLTVQQLQPTVTDVHELLKNGEYVGYHNGSYVGDLLKGLGFDRTKIRAYDNSDDFADVLTKGSQNGGISAVVHEVPYIKIFLAKHCKGYTMVGPIYKSEGFGFAFPKRSPLVNDFSRAILSITEGDSIIHIEKKWIGDQHACQNDGTIIGSSSLNFNSFSGLFLVTGVASTSALLIALMMFLYKNKHKVRNSISRVQTPKRYRAEHINEPNEEEVIGSNQVQNLQLTVPDDSDEYTCQQEGEISIELSPASGIQTSPDFASHAMAAAAAAAASKQNHSMGVERATERAAIFFLFLSLSVAQNITKNEAGTLNVGVILHLRSLVGKMARTSILMAVEDFYAVHRNFKTKLVLHIRDSNGDDIQAASEAIDLLENYNVSAIVGPQKSSEAAFVSKIGNKSQVPVISFTATNPTLSSNNIPYFLRGTLSDVAQVNVIAALIKAYGWREVVPIYEDTDYGRGIIPYLADALQELGAFMPYRSAISESTTTDQLERELYKLMTMQTRVYIVHMSSDIASILFTKAKDLGMMSTDYAWILTDGISNTVNSLSPSILEQMNGAIGVRFYVPASKELDDFTTRWNKRFKEDNPNDPPSQLSTFGIWGYDTIWTLAQAAEKVTMANVMFQKQKDTKNSTSLGTLGISTIGPTLLESILHIKFRGLSGKFYLRNRQLEFSTFQIINVVGSRPKEIGFWTAKHGIFRQMDENKTTNINSMPDLKRVMWPGEVYTVPKGWEIPTNGKKLRVGVRTSGYPELMKVERDPATNEITASGYAIDVFEEALKRLSYAIPYEYVAFDNGQGVNSGSYNDFVYQVHLGVHHFAGERVDNILSRLVVIVWVFVLLVITSSYTANLSSILTVQQLQPTVTDVHELLKNGEYVGYHDGSYLSNLLEGLGFDRTKMRAYDNSDDFADALAKGSQNGGISAVVHEVPYIKIFLAKHCKGYTMVGPIYKSEGFGFAFPKRSPLVYDFSRAIVNITEGDSIIHIENKWIGNQHACQNDGTITDSSSLNFNSFSGLFLVTGVASTSALLIALMMSIYKNKHRIRNRIRRYKTQKEYETEQIQEQNQETTLIDSNQVQNLQLTVPDDSDEYTCQQEGRISIELTLPSGIQTTQNATKTAVEFPVGVILDLQTLVGKIARTSLLMALDDFYSVHENYSTKIVLHIRDARGNNVQAASAALDLLENHNVQIIIGPQKSSQASFLSDLGNRSQVPVMSFTATSPSLYSASFPYFIRATLNDSAEVQSIACLIKAYGWRRVVPIYEDTDCGRGIIPYLIDALQEIDTSVPYRSVIPLSATSEEISKELYKLMTMQTRVFIVHMSYNLVASVFTKAKEVGMMNKGFVWIMTDGISNIIDSMDTSVVQAMNGALGIQFYVNKSEFDSFTTGWNRRFQIDNPNEPPFKPSIFGLWGYETIWAVAQAAEKVGVSNRTSFQKPSTARNSTSLEIMETSVYGPELLKVILKNKFTGKSGNFDLSDRQLQVSAFRIINVFGNGSKDIGFWTEENGISRQLNLGNSTVKYSSSVSDLDTVTWPGKSTEIPKGWEIPGIGKKLQVGVHKSAYEEYMTNEKDPITGATRANGLSIDIFEEAVNRLPYALPYEYVAFDTNRDTSTGSYDNFVYQVYLKKYDVTIGDITIFFFFLRGGDITIRYNRISYVDFTVPYTESGVAMVVPAKGSINKTWIFLQP